MTSMIERVARALCAPFDPDETIFLGGYQKRWKTRVDEARAAVEAMQEPTDAMVDAPLPSSPSHGGRYENRRDLRPYIYRAMIDAALNEQVSG